MTVGIVLYRLTKHGVSLELFTVWVVLVVHRYKSHLNDLGDENGIARL